MQRSIKRGALFVAPLVIASSLFAGSVNATQRDVIAMQLDTICVDVASEVAVYGLQNKNNFDIDVSWYNHDTDTEGTFVVPANSFHGDPDPNNNPGLHPGYAVDYDPSNPNNTTSFEAEGWTSPNTTNARVGVACSPEQLPQEQEVPEEEVPEEEVPGEEVPTETDEPGRGGEEPEVEAPVVTTPAPVKAAGGKGADVATATPVTNATSETLADTGAEQILPLAAAAMIAVAMLGMTVAVRKNVL